MDTSTEELPSNDAQISSRLSSFTMWRWCAIEVPYLHVADERLPHFIVMGPQHFSVSCEVLLIQHFPHLGRQTHRREWLLKESDFSLEDAMTHHGVIGVA